MNRLSGFTTLALSGALLLCASATSQATIIVVDTTEDSTVINGNCSLREAVIAANTNMATDDCAAGSATTTDDIWVFVAGTIVLNTEVFLVERVNLLGGGMDSTTISGSGSGGLLYVSTPDDSQNISISNLTLANGAAGLSGGAILVDRIGTLSIDRVRFRDNHSNDGGGAIGTRVAPGDNARLRISRSRFENNSATDEGGAIAAFGGPGYGGLRELTIGQTEFTGQRSGGKGGAIFNDDVALLDISRSRFHDSRVVSSGAVPDGGAVQWGVGTGSVSEQVRITSSTFSDNYSGGGSAIAVVNGVALIENSTFTRNLSDTNQGSVLRATGTAIVGIFHSTMIDNSYPGASTGSVLDLNSSSSLSMAHSIVWTQGNSVAPSCRTTGTASYTSAGYNIDSGSSCTGLGTDYPNTDPELFPLGDYGDGSTQVLLETFLPRPDSIAVDGGKDGPCTGAFGLTLATDQRGEPRPVDGDGSGGNAECDIGAVEYQPGIDPVARTLELAVFGSGSGRIEDAAGNILCTASNNNCDQQLPDGATISLTAIAETGSVFTGWDEDCFPAGTGSCTLTMDQDFTVSAGFNLAAQPASLTVSKDLSEPGLDAVITSTPTGVNCGTTCLANFSVGESVTLIAAPEAGTLVSGWAGCDSVSANGLNCTITLAGNSQVEAFLENSGDLIFNDGFD